MTTIWPGATDGRDYLAHPIYSRAMPRRSGLTLVLDPAFGKTALSANGPTGACRSTPSLPGFVDTHHHQYETILRGILADGVLGRRGHNDSRHFASIGYAGAQRCLHRRPKGIGTARRLHLLTGPRSGQSVSERSAPSAVSILFTICLALAAAPVALAPRFSCPSAASACMSRRLSHACTALCSAASFNARNLPESNICLL